MDSIFAFEISIIQFIQHVFSGFGPYFATLNSMCHPSNVSQFLFPMMSIFDSVFASELLLCLTFGSWMMEILKKCLAEDRPYWWVKETKYYRPRCRPRLLLTSDTCMVSPGNPSSHAAVAAILVMLITKWSANIMEDIVKNQVCWWNCILHTLCAIYLISSMLARIYVVAHFPHQVVLGAAIGIFLVPALLTSVSDPTILRQSCNDPLDTIIYNLWYAVLAGLISGATHFAFKMMKKDPNWSVKKAKRWCNTNINPRVITLFWSVQNFSSLVGWALTATPDLAKYRHFTKDRSIPLSFFLTATLVYCFCIHKVIFEKRNKFDFLFYLNLFLINVLKPLVFLRIIPALAMSSEFTDVHKALWLFFITAIGKT